MVSLWTIGWVLAAVATVVVFFATPKRVNGHPKAGKQQERPADLRSFEEIPQATSTIPPDKWLQIHSAWLLWWRETGRQAVFRTPVMGKDSNTVIVTDPVLVGHVYTRLPKDKGYDRFHYMLGPRLPLGEGVFSSTHEDRTWRATRKHIAPFFSLPNLRSKVPIMTSKALLLSKKLREFGPNPVETQDAMKRLTLDTFLPAGGFGFELNALNFEPCQFLSDLHFAFWEAAICSLQPWRRWWMHFSRFWSPVGRKFVDHHNRLYKMWADVWRNMDKAPQPSEKDVSMTACMKRLAASEDGAHMTRKQMEYLAGGMLIAGLDSQGLTLSFTLMCLAAHPHKQALVVRELQQLGLVASASHPEPRTLVADDLPKLHYLDAAIKESERLMPVTGLGTARHTAQAMQLGDYWLPANTRLIVAAAILHQDEDSWAEPGAYLPERWLSDLSPDSVSKATGQPELSPDTLHALHKETAVRKAAQSDAIAAARQKYRFATFAHGSRSCPGYGFANMQLLVVLATLIGRFEVSLAPQMGGWQGCRDKEINAFTLMLIGGNWMVFSPRDGLDSANEHLAPEA